MQTHERQHMSIIMVTPIGQLVHSAEIALKTLICVALVEASFLANPFDLPIKYVIPEYSC